MHRMLLRLLLLGGCGLQPLISLAQQAPSIQAAASATSSIADPLGEARQDLQRNELPRAEATLRHYLLSTPGSAEAHFLLGYMLFREIQSHAADASDLTDTGRQKMFAGIREKNARASLAEYTEGARSHAPSAFDLKIVAFDYILLNDYRDADTWMTRSLEWAAGDKESWYYEGRIKFKKAEYQQSIDAFRHALALAPHDIKAEDGLGLAYEGSGRIPEAIAAYQQAIEWARAPSAPQDNAPDNNAWIDLGSLLTAQGRAQDAVPYLQEAVKLSPGDLRAHLKLAEAYRALSRWPEVQSELERAVALSPDSSSLHFMLSQAYRQNGELTKAKSEVQRTAALKAQETAATRATEEH